MGNFPSLTITTHRRIGQHNFCLQFSLAATTLEVAETRSESVHRLHRVVLSPNLRSQWSGADERLLQLLDRHQQPGQLLHLLGRQRRVSSQAEGDVHAITRVKRSLKMTK